jgi:twitching motility protein PilT
MTRELEQLLHESVERRASDIHFAAGEPPIFRISGVLERQLSHPKLSADDLANLLLPTLPEAARLGMGNGTLSSAKTVLTFAEEPQMECHLTLYRSEDGLGATARLLSDQIPALELIAGDVLPLLEKIVDLRRGLVLFTGPTGSGKLTTAAAVVETINARRSERIFSLRDSGGYTWRSKKSVITTLLIGRDHETYDRAAEVVMRGADPDVILFEDIPTPEAARQALILADTGHLVIACVGAESVTDTIARLARALPEPRDTAHDLLARNLVAVFNQRLFSRSTGRGRVPAYETLFVTPAVRKIIRAGAARDELDAAMEQGGGDMGARTLSAAIDALLAAGQITEETANQNRPERAGFV